MEAPLFTAEQYEQKYRTGYGVVYPESHVVRFHRHVLEWELRQVPGAVFDFGCGSGAHLHYFASHGYIPYGCDVSATAIERCRQLMPRYRDHFVVTPPVRPDLRAIVRGTKLRLFISNQVLYYLADDAIRELVHQAHEMLEPGGVFMATMMSTSCWYARYAIGRDGDFTIIQLETPRLRERTLINFKRREDLEPLFAPFRKLHIGWYASQIREEEGSTDHWIYIGVRERE